MTSDLESRQRRLLGPGAAEVTCDECFALLDAFVDVEVAGADAPTRFPGMTAHLAGCPACADEHDGLLEFARSTTNQRNR
jgi:hypothetical protein